MVRQMFTILHDKQLGHRWQATASVLACGSELSLMEPGFNYDPISAASLGEEELY
jgi:hypothetical protein